jgi:hypothetical protein
VDNVDKSVSLTGISAGRYPKRNPKSKKKREWVFGSKVNFLGRCGKQATKENRIDEGEKY